MDPEQAALEDLVRQQRIEEIYRLKMSIEQLEEEIARGIATNRISGDPRTAYLLMVKSYVRALEPVLAPADGTVSPHWSTTVLGQYERPDGSSKRVVGLGEFVTLEAEDTVTWTTTERPRRNARPQELKKRATVRPPRRIAENAFRAANAGLRSKGLDIDPEDTTIGSDEAADDGGIGV